MPTAATPELSPTPVPPLGFDPGDIVWVGDDHGSNTMAWAPSDLWLGTLAGDDVRTVVDGDVISAFVMSTGQVVFTSYVGGDAEDWGPLWLNFLDLESGTITTHPEPDLRIAIPQAADSVLVTPHRGKRPADGGVWRVPLDGTQIEQLIPPVGTATIFEFGPVTSADGQRVTRANCEPEAPSAQLQVLTDGALHTLDPAIPIGFHPDGRLIAFGDTCQRGRVDALDPLTGQRTRLLTGYIDDAMVKGPDAILAATRLPDDGGMELLALDLQSDELRVWPLETSAWQLTQLGGDRYVVLEGSPTDEPGAGVWYAVIDLAEGWIAYVPPLVDLAAP